MSRTFGAVLTPAQARHKLCSGHASFASLAPKPGIFVKKATKTQTDQFEGVAESVREMLAEIQLGGTETVLRYSSELDKYEGKVLYTRDDMAAATDQVPLELKANIEFAHKRVRAFAEAQRRSVQDFEIELGPGSIAGQRIIPVDCAGCYCPGGRYTHVASAVMSVTTARAAGVPLVVMASPPKPGVGVPPTILFAAHLAGADMVLALGGVQALASMKHGLFTGARANILVGPGSGYVAEAKMQLMGPDCGIDMFAGPTETCILADASADPDLVAIDLVSQGEHGPTSPCWFITTSQEVGEAVARKVPEYIEFLPEPNRSAARTAWKDYGEIVVAADSEQMAVISDSYAPEHLQVLCEEQTLSWWKDRLRNYGSLFLGEGTCVTYGDKASGPNHTLPTLEASKVTGGLSVHDFLKKVTWQRQDPQEGEDLALAAAVISRHEGMEGHAWSADARLAKFASTADKRKTLLQRSGASGAGVDKLFSKL